jgi:hypothetical protein
MQGSASAATAAPASMERTIAKQEGSANGMSDSSGDVRLVAVLLGTGGSRCFLLLRESEETRAAWRSCVPRN